MATERETKSDKEQAMGTDDLRDAAKGRFDDGRGQMEGWRKQVVAAIAEVIELDQVEELRAQVGDLGRMGDLTLAAHFDEVRLIEKARFHRARRDLARELAIDPRSDEAVTAREHLADRASTLGLLRIERDLVRGELKLDEPRPDKPVPDKPVPDKPVPNRPTPAQPVQAMPNVVAAEAAPAKKAAPVKKTPAKKAAAKKAAPAKGAAPANKAPANKSPGAKG